MQRGENQMNPLLLDVPLKLETERLMLRAPLQAGEGEMVRQAIGDSFNELKSWLSLFQEPPTVEETEVMLKNAHINFLKRESFRFLIFDKGGNDFIGTTSLHNIDWNIPKCEVGYCINTKYSGNGYMTEAVKEMVNFVLNHLEFKRIGIKCDSTNLKSRAIPEKLGFVLEGILRNDDLSADGKKLTDTCVYSIIK